MATTETIPVTIEPDAAARAEALGMRDELDRMIDQCKAILSGLRSVEVELQYDPCGSGEPTVLVHAYRHDPGPGADESDRRWKGWFMDTFPPEVINEFGMLSWYGGPDGR